MDGSADACRLHRRAHHVGQPVYPLLHQVLQEGTDDVEGEHEHRRHDGDEGGYGRPLAGKQLVYALASQLLLALVGPHHAGGHDPLDKREAHVGDGGRAIEAPLLLHLRHDLLHGLFLARGEIERGDHVMVPLHHLGGRKVQGDPRPLGMIGYELCYGLQAALYRARLSPVVEELLHSRELLVACHMHGMVNELVHALVVDGGYGDHRDAQHGLHEIGTHVAAVALHLVHHVEGKHHGDAQLQELRREVEVAVDVGGIHDVYDAAGPLVEDEATAHDLLRAVR